MNHTTHYFVILIAVLLSGCQQHTISTENGKKIPVTMVLAKDTVCQTEYVATIQAVQTIEIRTRIAAHLQQMLADEGNIVQAGQPLFRLSKERYQEELAKASAKVRYTVAQAEQAAIDMKNAQALAEKKIIAESEFEKFKLKFAESQANIEEAKAEELSAKHQLSFTEIKAPFTGILHKIHRKTGSLLEEGALLTTLSDHQSVYAYFRISEQEYLAFQTQNPESKTVSLILADHSKYPYSGIIETMDGGFDPQTGTIAVRARFPNPERLLREGASGKIVFTKKLPNAILIPQKSTFEIQDKIFAYVVDKNSRVQSRNLKISQRLSNLFVVQTGLEPGDQLVYEGFQSLQNGEKIQTEFLPIETLLQN